MTDVNEPQNVGMSPEVEVTDGVDLPALLAERDMWKDKAYRQAAEADNAKRRAFAEVESARKFALQGFAKDLLPIADNLLRALDAPAGNEQALRQGVVMVAAQLEQVFNRNGIAKVKVEVGQALNPEVHQAMSQVASNQPVGTIAAELQGGYTLQERLLRPALVTVSGGEQG